jgi:hypothetical protein
MLDGESFRTIFVAIWFWPRLYCFNKADQCAAAEVVMTPSKKDKTTVIRIEKVKRTSIDESQVAHKAGGQHSGLVINKQAVPGLYCS